MTDCGEILLRQLSVGQVVLDLENAGSFVRYRGRVVLVRVARFLESHPEVRRGQAPGLQIGVRVPLLEQALATDLSEQVSRDRPGPDPLDLGLPGLGQ